MRRAWILLMIVTLALTACERREAPTYAAPDAAADSAAYRALMPAADAPEVDAATLPTHSLAAFNFAGTHFRTPLGWWYFNAHALDERGRRWAFMFAILADNQFYGVLSSPDAGVFVPFYAQSPTRIDRANLTAASGEVATLRQLERGRLAFEFKLRDEAANLDVSLTALKPPVAVGGEGAITMGDTGRSEYYFIPSMRVAGTLRAGGQDAAIAGLGWMDHQWGLWDYGKIESWHWFSIHLTDGTDVMAFAFVRDGKIAKVDCDASLADGTHRAGLACTTQPLRTWRSEATGRTWTPAWRIEAPELKLSLEVVADRENMEINRTVYEGGALVTGTRAGAAIAGRAFYEESQI